MKIFSNVIHYEKFKLTAMHLVSHRDLFVLPVVLNRKQTYVAHKNNFERLSQNNFYLEIIRTNLTIKQSHELQSAIPATGIFLRVSKIVDFSKQSGTIHFSSQER